MTNHRHDPDSTAGPGGNGQDFRGSGPARASGGRLWAFCLVAALSTSAAHVRAVSLGFVKFDDGAYVTENEHVLSGLTRDSVAWAFRKDPGRETYFHPLTWLSLMLDRELFGIGPLGFHAVNVALHAATAVLLMLFLAGATGRPWPSLAAALLFAAHPLTVEGVAWIPERKLVLSSALGMAALLAYLSYCRAPSWRRMAGVVALHAASLLAKPGLVILPALLLVLDFWPLRRLRPPGRPGRDGAASRSLGALLVEKIPSAIVSAASVAVAIASARNLTEPEGVAPPLGLRAANAIVSIPKYLALAAWPERLSAFHPYPTAVPAAHVVAAALAIAAVTVLCAWTAARRPWLLSGWLWFLVALSPYLGLKQAGMWPAWADRFAYVGLMGLAVAVGFEGAELARRGRWGRTVAGLVGAAAMAALCTATWIQTGYWSDPETLYLRVLDIEPDVAILRHQYGTILADSGRIDEALVQLNEAVRLDPGVAKIQYQLGTLLAMTGRVNEAIPHLENAIRIQPVYPEAHGQVANAYRVVGRLAHAEEHYRTALSQAPGQAEALYNFGDFLRLTGKVGEARAQYERFLRVAGEARFAPQRAAVERWLASGR